MSEEEDEAAVLKVELETLADPVACPRLTCLRFDFFFFVVCTVFSPRSSLARSSV
jgi:hypothetical protein